MNTQAPTHPPRIGLASLLLLGVTSGWLQAQTAPADSAAPADDTIVLTPFEVRSDADHGYQATSTLAGTRIRTDLKDVSASISVVTKEFLDDVGATDSATLLQYTTNAEVAGTRGTYAGLGNGQSVDETDNLRAPGGAQRVRGLAAADNARDYYITDIPWDSYNVDRVDILRGPNSILYGLGSPAGIINASTRSAEFRNTGTVEARTGSYGTFRASLDVNQQLLPNVLAIRFDALWNKQKFEQKPAFQDDKRFFGAVRFDPQLFQRRDFHTSFKAKFENGDITANRPRIIPPNDSITAWFRPVDPSSITGGMGKTYVNNPYDPWRNDTANITAGDGLGLTQSTTVNYQPWLSDMVNQQQPYWLLDGATNQQYAVNGGYINNGALYADGSFTGVSTGMAGKQTNGMFYGLTNLPGYVTASHNANAAYFPDAQYGQYRTMSLTDSSVFDFYHTLIDGPTKSEFEKWNALDLDFSQTGWDDRVGVELSYDRQRYKRGGQALLGGSPTLTIDVLNNFPDYYLKGGDGRTTATNPNVGRPYVIGGGSAGTGSSYYSDRKYYRGSLFGELRASDFFGNDFLVKLLGKQRFNVVGADERYFNENRRWQMYANSQAWNGYWNQNDGSTTSFTDRSPTAFIYLGGSIASRDSAAGAGIPGITTDVTMQNSGVYVFDTTWKNATVSPSDPWTVPSSLSVIYRPGNQPTVGGVQYDQWYQNSNPANYVGWNSSFQDNLMRYDNGKDESLLTLAQKSLRETTSYSGSWQGFFWKNALVTTLGWRFDEVKTKDATAQNQPANRSILNLQPGVYELPDEFPANQIFKGHSTSGGLVLHINDVLPHDPLPLDVSVGYNESSNFQVTSVRRDVYGNSIANPTGNTREYSLSLSTKDGKYSFRAVKFDTKAFNTSSTLSNSYLIGSTVGQGLRWRNVFLYDLGGYDLASREQPSYRNTWTNAYPTLSDSAAQAEEDAAIDGWNGIQQHLAAKGFFSAWNFNPLNDSALVNRTTYLSNPGQYAPDPNTVYAYAPVAPQGFSVTADTESTGYEFEFVANPLPNWRVAFNASRTQAVQNNVGGAALADFVSYMNSQLINSDGTLTPAGKLPQYGGAANAIYPAIWGNFMASYTLLQLQQGAANPEIRKWRYNVVSSYDFRKGRLKGAGIGAAYRWQDKVVIGYPVVTGGSFASYDLSKPYYGPAEDALDLWVSYQRKLTDKINWKIQLNVYNVGKKEGLIPISVEPDGHTWASARIAPVQEWMLTNTFSF